MPRSAFILEFLVKINYYIIISVPCVLTRFIYISDRQTEIIILFTSICLRRLVELEFLNLD
jgi:hypothetical protein